MKPRPPELFALLHPGTPGDLAFYRARCAGAARVLELGCGAGRVLLDLARTGHAVTGIDRDPGLLALAREALGEEPAQVCARVTLVDGDMRRFALGRRFERIVIPYNGLYCLADDDEVAACLRCAGEHLSPGGEIVFDAWAADAFHAEADPDEPDAGDDQPITHVAWRGRTYDVFEASEWQRAAQRIRAGQPFHVD